MGYASAAATVLVEALRDAKVRTIEREDLRRRWYEAHPHHDRQVLRTEGSKVRKRRRTYLAGANHRAGQSSGRRGRLYLTQGLKVLEGMGIIVLAETAVTVLDVPRLVEIYEGRL